MEDTGDEYVTNDLPMLQLQDLVDAVSGTAGALRCRTRLQPAGGAGDKVFPPTYAGAVYAIEHRRVPIKNDDRADGFETVPCVLLDSVQSQANRMEEALQNALEHGRVRIPIVNVDFSPFYPGLERDESLRLLDAIGVVTSLQLPHRIADAILRESRIGDTAFRQTPTGKLIDGASLSNATPLFRLCPTALIFGMWDSSGPKGGLGAKFERAITSEIVGIGARIGSRTQSRRDPIIGKNPTLYENAAGDWTADEGEAVRGSNGPKKYGKKLSKLNLGSVTPDYARYDEKAITDENRETPDPLRGDGANIRGGRIRPGGVTVEFGEQTTVISLPALR